jgi:SagB-type dehydrogenase family enzyme
VKRDEISRPSPAVSKDAAYENSFKGVYLGANATGLRPHGFRHRTQGFSQAPRVAEEFLVNSRLLRCDREIELAAQGFYFDAAAVMYTLVGHESLADAKTLPLPKPVKLHMELGEALRRRRSKGDYSGERLASSELATIVWSAGGVTGRGKVDHVRGGQTWVNLRVTPSGGALYPIELYVAVLNVDDVPPGIYRYEPLSHQLLVCAVAEEMDQLLSTFCIRGDQVALGRAGVILLLVARPWRSMRKYGPRGMRHVFLEAGYMAQNVHLTCVSLGLGSLDCSSFYDDEVHEVLRLDGVYEALVHTLIVGHPAGD